MAVRYGVAYTRANTIFPKICARISGGSLIIPARGRQRWIAGHSPVGLAVKAWPGRVSASGSGLAINGYRDPDVGSLNPAGILGSATIFPGLIHA